MVFLELEHQQIERLRQLDTAQIEKIVLHAADSMGLSQKKASLLARHSGTLQKKLQKMSDAEINRFASVLGEEQVKKLLSQLE